jgi:diaminohydroxyphosphoribosylaminopyrimidine deaminase/5-amino-6-(5-phosphoribosylamino)uracil reductase
VHELRNRVDAVLVGSGTVLADDPALTCRVRGGRDPLRVVVDGRLRTPPRARMLRQRSNAATLIATTRTASPRRAVRLAKAGADVVRVASRRGIVDLGALLDELARRGIVSVLIEGGGEVAAAALRDRVVDRLLVVSAPSIIGGDGRAMLAAMGVRRLAKAPRLVDARITRLGADLLREGPVAY